MSSLMAQASGSADMELFEEAFILHRDAKRPSTMNQQRAFVAPEPTGPITGPLGRHNRLEHGWI